MCVKLKSGGKKRRKNNSFKMKSRLDTSRVEEELNQQSVN